MHGSDGILNLYLHPLNLKICDFTNIVSTLTSFQIKCESSFYQMFCCDQDAIKLKVSVRRYLILFVLMQRFIQSVENMVLSFHFEEEISTKCLNLLDIRIPLRYYLKYWRQRGS